jgi:hypothetical protein
MSSIHSITSGVPAAAARLEAPSEAAAAQWFDDDPDQRARILHAPATRAEQADAAALAERFLSCLCTTQPT